jgi:hypothetical protein
MLNSYSVTLAAEPNFFLTNGLSRCLDIIIELLRKQILLQEITLVGFLTDSVFRQTAFKSPLPALVIYPKLGVGFSAGAGDFNKRRQRLKTLTMVGRRVAFVLNRIELKPEP